MSGSNDMQRTLKGVVRDHRVPTDYRFHYTQPMLSGAFRKNLSRWFWNRIYTKQNIAQPMVLIWVSAVCKLISIDSWQSLPT